MWSRVFVVLIVVLVPGLVSAQSNPVPELNRPSLKQDDFEYLGAFALPHQACGRSTAFGASGLALRHGPGNKIQFFTGSHRHGNDAVYEFDFPGFSKEAGKWPMAKILKEYGMDIYGGLKLIKKGKEIGLSGGFTFDERKNRFYFSFGSWYNIPNDNDPSIAYATLQDDKIVETVGPWNADFVLAHNQKVRGGSLLMPDWFATNFTDGRRLGMGFGGYYSGVAACSKGPYFAAAPEPTADNQGGTLDVLPLINHDDKHWGERDTDYKSEVSWSPNPKNGVGFWGLYDELFGAAVWIDLPDKHGLLMVSNMGHGRVWYETSDRWADRLEAWWWVYNPKDLAAVALGKKKSHEPRPTFWKMDYTPRQHRVETTGLAFDAETRTLFLLAPQSVKDGVEYFPLVHGYRIKK
ncbi:MAG: hypothetical protein ACRC8S_04890 [Fimbriiglobus sp.]